VVQQYPSTQKLPPWHSWQFAAKQSPPEEPAARLQVDAAVDTGFCGLQTPGLPRPFQAQ
jgi:hypothetical protein